MELAYSFAGLAVGFIVGLTGIGGGALMTPILIMGFGIAPIVAVSTDLLYAAVTKCAGVVSYSRKKMVEWSIVIYMALGSIPGAWLTLEWLSQLDHIAQIEKMMNLTLGVSLVLTSLAVFFRNRIRYWSQEHSVHPLAAHFLRLRPVLTVIAGVILGVLVTLSSVGAGALGTAILILFYPHLSMKSIVGTDLVHAVLLTSVAGVGHYKMGSVDTTLLMFLLLGSLPGVFAGSYLGTRLSAKLMQPIMGSLLLGIGLKFVIAG